MKPLFVFLLPRALRRAERSEARLNVRGGDLDLGSASPSVVVVAFGAWPFGAEPSCCREPEAFTVHLQNVDMMGEAVEQRAGEPFRSEDRGPFIEWQVAGDERGAAFVALAEHLEEQLGADRRERHVAQFIDDQQLDRVEMLLQRPQTAFVARFHEFMHEGRSRREGDAVALLAGGEPQCQGDMGLAGAGGSKGDFVVPLLDPFAACQLQNQLFVERRLGGEVEGVEP